MGFILAFILGAMTTPLLPKSLLLPHWVQLLLLLLLALAVGLAVVARRPLATRVMLLLTLVLAGSTVAGIGVQQQVDASLEERWHGQNLILRGEIEEVVDASDRFTRFHFRVRQVEVQGASADEVPALSGQLIRLSWYYGPAVAEGEQWHLTTRLKRPRGFLNPSGFDYSAWLLSQTLVATGYVREGERKGTPTVASALAQVRLQLAGQITAAELESAPFFRALLLGNTSSISSEQWRVLQRTGTIHLMAISGLHVGLVAALGYALGSLLARGLGLIPVRLGRATLPGMPPVRWLPGLISCGLAFGYSALAGFAIPTQRALIIVLLANVAILYGVRTSPLRLLALACVLVLLTNPLAPTQNGFWLSFLAVVVLILGFGGRVRSVGFFSSLVRAQLLLGVGLVAPLLMLGQPLSLVGPVGNLVAVPVVSLLIVPGLLVAGALGTLLPAMAALLLRGLDAVFGLMWQFLAVLSRLENAVWWPGFELGAAAVAALVLGAGLLLAPRGLGLRGLGLLLLVAGLLAPRSAPPPVTVTVLEVGQGLAVWVRVRDHNLLYDTGPAFSEDFDAGSRIVVPFLRSRGVRHLDLLMVSHSDNDHSGGLQGILDNLPVSELVVGEQVAVASDLKPELCFRGQRWRWHHVELRVLWPGEEGRGPGNDSSCVLLLQWGEQRVLLTGDIDTAIEQQLLDQGVLPADLTLVVAPHHGSKTSSSHGFVAQVAPDSVVFSAGYQNRYGHPHPDVVARYRAVAGRLLNTGEDGAVTFVWDQKNRPPRIRSARRELDRAWH